MQHQANIDVALGKYNHAFGRYYFCPVILRLIRGRQNVHAGYVSEPSLVTTELSSAMTVMTVFTSDVGILHLLNTTLQSISHFTWTCPPCGSINLSTTFINDNDIDISNPYSSLTEELSRDEDGNVFESTINTTSSEFDEEPPKLQKTHKSIKLMVVNCNSLVNNRTQALFSQLIDDHKPNIVCGCESKLDNTIKSQEVFPTDEYEIYRRQEKRRRRRIYCGQQ
jgi:hypothetical protein